MYRASRRLLLADLGRTTAGLIVSTSVLAACSSAGDDAPVGRDDTPPDPTVDPLEEPTAEATTAADPGSPTDDGADQPSGPTTPTLVDLGFVAVYLLERDGQIAIVDTGVLNSLAAIEEALTGIGGSWGDVSHLFVTHMHDDHDGSLPAVSEQATEAVILAGAPDIPSMHAVREIQAVGDGEVHFGLQVIATPGHTPGHISIYDPAARFLVTGDALVGTSTGALGGPPERFTPDMGTAARSVARLAEFDVEETLVSHGFPVSGQGTAELQALADSMG